MIENAEQFDKHLFDRHLYVFEDVYLDYENFVVTFILRNFQGDFVGYQNYRPNASKEKSNDEKGRYYTYVSDRAGDYCYGMKSLAYRTMKPVVVVEGIFDQVRFRNLQFSCLAVLTNNPKYLKNSLDFLSQKRPTVAVCDGGEAGRKLAKYCTYSIQLPGEKDPGDLSKDEMWKLRNKILEMVE